MHLMPFITIKMGFKINLFHIGKRLRIHLQETNTFLVSILSTNHILEITSLTFPSTFLERLIRLYLLLCMRKFSQNIKQLKERTTLCGTCLFKSQMKLVSENMVAFNSQSVLLQIPVLTLVQISTSSMITLTVVSLVSVFVKVESPIYLILKNVRLGTHPDLKSAMKMPKD